MCGNVTTKTIEQLGVYKATEWRAQISKDEPTRCNTDLKMNNSLLLLMLWLACCKCIISEQTTRINVGDVKARQIPEMSQFTDGNVYEILTVALLASLGSFLIPSFSTFMTYIISSNRCINRPKKKGKVPPKELSYLIEQIHKQQLAPIWLNLYSLGICLTKKFFFVK